MRCIWLPVMRHSACTIHRHANGLFWCGCSDGFLHHPHRHVHTAYIVQEFGELNRSTRGETTHLDLAPPFVFVQADCGRGRATVTVYTLTSSIACSMAWSPMQLQPYSTYIFVVTESMRLSWQDACARVPWLAPYNNSYMRWLPVRRCRRCGINKNTKPVRLSASVCFLLLLLSFAIWLELGARERMNCWLVDICTSAHNVFAFSSASFDGDMMLDYNSPSRALTQKQQQHQAPQSRRWAHSVNRRSRIIIKHRHAPSSAAMCNGNRHGNASDTQLYVAFTCEVWPCDSCRSCHCEYHSHCESITAQTIESSVDLRRCRCCRRHHRHRRRSRSHPNVIWMEHQYY